MKNNRYIPTKNYVITLLIVIGSILLALYIFSWYQAFKKEQYAKSYLVSNNIVSNEITSIEELTSVLSETPNDYFLMISYTQDKDTYELEKDIAKIIEDYELKNYFYYFNISDINNDDNYINDINKALNLKDNQVTKVPTIIFFQNKTVGKDGIIKRDDLKIMDAGDFQKLLDINNIIKP